MKYLFSISFLIIYLIGVIQPSWILIDFYTHRDEYTLKYCRFLDEGITQCRASCYLQSQLDSQQKENTESKFIASQQQKKHELNKQEKTSLYDDFDTVEKTTFFYSTWHQYNVIHIIFHPPKV